MFKFSVGDAVVVKEGLRCKEGIKMHFHNPNSVYKTLVVKSLKTSPMGTPCYCFEDCKSWLFEHEIEKLKKGQLPLPFKEMR